MLHQYTLYSTAAALYTEQTVKFSRRADSESRLGLIVKTGNGACVMGITYVEGWRLFGCYSSRRAAAIFGSRENHVRT